MGEQIFGTQFLVEKKKTKNRPEAKTNRQTFNGVIFPLLHFQQQLYRSNMSLWHKRTPSGSVSLCLNCNRYPGYRGGRGGTLGYFLGGYVPPGTSNWHPVLKKISPKIDTPF